MNRKATLLVITVFVLGIALGGLSFHVAADRGWTGEKVEKSSPARRGPERTGMPGREGGKARSVEYMKQELGLTPEQEQTLDAILEETQKQYQSIYQQIRPQLDQTRQEGRQKIRAILTPEQLPKFEAYLQRVDEERRKRDKR